MSSTEKYIFRSSAHFFFSFLDWVVLGFDIELYELLIYFEN